MDPLGYDRLARALDFLIVESGAAGVDSQQIQLARRFYGGSPTEFLGESLIALEQLLAEGDDLPPSVQAFASSMAGEIRHGFEQVGGG